MEDKLLQQAGSFSSFNAYYDLLYRDKPYQQETLYIDALLQEYGKDPVELLELGSGTGNYAQYLCKAGYNVTGIEKSAEMVAVAQLKRIPRFFPIVDDITTFSINRKFDVAVSLFHVISYLTENADILSCFRRVSQHLQKDGMFVFDAWYTPAVYTQRPETRVKHIHTGDGELVRIAEPTVLVEKNVVRVDYTLMVKSDQNESHKMLKETHFMRHFSTTEIQLFAELSGLVLIGTEEFLTKKKPSENTWGVCFILKKNE